MSYTDEDLAAAEQAGVLSPDQANAFRRFVERRRNSPAVDEENFRFLSSFNDIFVTLACGLVLFAGYWLLKQSLSEQLAYILTAAVSWGIAEYFSRKRHLALPSIFLLAAFIFCIASAVAFAPGTVSETTEIISRGLAVAVATFLHWRRFKVPVTVAVGAGAALVVVIGLLVQGFPVLEKHLNILLFFGGLALLSLAMSWDLSDRERITYRSDAAFWLHLLAAPLLIHPVFGDMVDRDSADSMGGALFIILIYVLISLISVCIDRRALMVSGLAYALYAMQIIFRNYGLLDASLAVTALLIGAGLLLLSALWQKVRHALVSRLPDRIQGYLPTLN
ncbi:MAG: hypothetical protein ACON4W_05895 [Parvibaculales bacterium]